MIELHLLKALSNKDSFFKYRPLLNNKTLSKQSIKILKDYESYFDKYESHNEIDFGLFKTYFFMTKNPYLDMKSIEEYEHVLQTLGDLKVNGEIKDIYHSFETKEFYNDLAGDISRHIDIGEIQHKIDAFVKSQSKLDTEGDVMCLDHILHDVDRSEGLRWKLPCLREWFGASGLTNGDFVLVAAAPGAGKTSFIANEIGGMAQQLKEGNIYVFSNEDTPQKTSIRLWTSILNGTEEAIRKDPERAKKLYTKAVGGDINRIIVKGVQGWSANDIEAYINERQDRCKLIVIDMMDNIQGFDKFYNKENATEKYNRLYQWARDLSVRICPVIGTSQLNSEGAQTPYPDIRHLRGSQIDKQGAVTFQIMIGKELGDEQHRYISLVKDKLSIGYKAQQVKFDPLKARYM